MDNLGGARFDFVRLKQQMAQAPGNRGVQFGAVETYFGLGGTNYVTNAASYKKELDEMFAQGARVQVVFGGFPFARNSPAAAVEAVTRWLRETPAETAPGDKTNTPDTQP